MATVASGGDSPVRAGPLGPGAGRTAHRTGRALRRRRSPRSSSCSPTCAPTDATRSTARPGSSSPASRGASTRTARPPPSRPPSRLPCRAATENVCAATLPRALLDGGAAVASGRHPGPGLWARRWWPARRRRVGRPRPGAAVCRRPHRRRSPAGRPSMPTDPRRLRGDAPLLDAWLRFHEQAPTPFTIPGHKQRRDLVGDVVAGDVPLYAGLDTMKLARGVVAEAEARAARLWGADLCRFSVGGSTHGNQALALAVARPGDRVVVARTLHRSMLLGLVLAGLEPVWLRPEVDATHGLPTRCHGRRPRGRARRGARRQGRLRRRPVLRRHRRRRGRPGHGGAPARHPARRRCRVGRAPRLPPRAAAARARRRRRRAGDQRAQGAAGLVAGRAGAGAQPPDRPGPLRRRRRGDRHDQPVGRDPRQHRCRPRAARARRRGPARPGHRGRGHGARAARPGARPASCSTARGSTRCG